MNGGLGRLPLITFLYPHNEETGTPRLFYGGDSCRTLDLMWCSCRCLAMNCYSVLGTLYYSEAFGLAAARRAGGHVLATADW